MKLMSSLVAITAIAFAAPSHANSSTGAVDPIERIVIAASDTAKSEGEIRKVDPETKKITIKHGELKNLDMPAMTMVFRVNDPTMIERVKAGDKVVFRADKVNGVFTVMEIEVVK